MYKNNIDGPTYFKTPLDLPIPRNIVCETLDYEMLKSQDDDY